MPKQNVLIIGLCCLLACSTNVLGMNSKFESYRLKHSAPRIGSWPAKVEYSPTSVYLLYGPQQSTAVHIQELNYSGQGYLLNQFGELLPSGYDFVEPKRNMLTLDPIDALCLGVLIPSADIVNAALDIMNTSKSFEKKGLSRCDLTPSINLLCSTLTSKINHARLLATTLIAATPVLVYGMYKHHGLATKIAGLFISPDASFGHIQAPNDLASQQPVKPQPNYDLSPEARQAQKAAYDAAKQDANYLTYISCGLTAAAGTAATYLTYKHEAAAINNGIACLELLVSAGQSNETTYISDTKLAKQSISALQRKLTWWNWATAVDKFGMLNEEAVNRLQAVVDCLG